VYTVVDDHAKRVSVSIGIIQDGRVEITRGLRDNDLVVVKGQFLINDGAQVRFEVPRDREAT